VFVSPKVWVFIAVLVGSAAVPATADYSVTDLVAAAKRGDTHAVHYLVAGGADLDVRDPMGYTALHWAGIRGHWTVFSELVTAGTPINAIGGDGGTPLHWACHHDRPDMIARLIDAGADQNVSNRWGRTPLHVAARRGCGRVARLLIERGVEIDATTNEGWTPLHVAYRSDHPEMVQILLEAGADPALRDKEGLTPSASHNPRPKAVKLDPHALTEYQGLFDLGGGLTLKVWREADHLRIREFAPDDLDPIGVDRFFCRREPWRVVFLRNTEREISGIHIDFLRRSFDGEKIPAPSYVGSRVCLECHGTTETGSQYVIWLRSRHAHAYWRLAADWALYLGRLRPQYGDLETPADDGRCLLCHVTGRQDDNAIFESTFRAEEGVGCESCHGPGSNYIDPEIMSDRAAFLANGGRVADQTTCRSCHRKSETFDFAASWPEITHMRPRSTPSRGQGSS